MSGFSKSIPDRVKASFFEYQRKEWEKVLESSVNSRIEENALELQLHWNDVCDYARERIKEIDKQLLQLKTQ